MLSVLARENKGGPIIQRLQEEIQAGARKADQDVTPITMALMAGFQHTRGNPQVSKYPYFDIIFKSLFLLQPLKHWDQCCRGTV